LAEDKKNKIGYSLLPKKIMTGFIMQFYYLDSQGSVHAHALSKAIPQSIVDIDLQWLNLGHKIFPKRLHSMICFEKLLGVVPEDHQFAFRQWYEPRTDATHCLWYSVPKNILSNLPEANMEAKSLVFVLQKFFPPSCRNQSVLCFVDLPDCELVAGYLHGHCLCFKKLPARTPINVQHEWLYLQQAYPQWTFDHSVYLTCRSGSENNLVQTHQHILHLDVTENILASRILLYGLD
jgi:hypothetical protein